MAHGYNPSRFIHPVRQDYLCGICHCVLKDPRSCEAKEHYFCLSCITQYLDKESQTCPECQKPLTLETLKRPRFLPMFLSELIIKCDYKSRGCPEFAVLGKLEDHLSVCEYRPVMCESCGQQVNEKDVDNHKKSFCHLGRANMQVIEGMKTRQDEMFNEIKTISARTKEIMERQNKLEELQNTRGKELDFQQKSKNDDLVEVAADGHKENHTFTTLYRCEVSEIRGIDVTQDDVPYTEVKKMKRDDLIEVTHGQREIHTFTNADRRRTRNDKRRNNEREDVSKDFKKVKKSPQTNDLMKVVNGHGESHTFTIAYEKGTKREMNKRQDEQQMEVKKMKEDVAVIKQTLKRLAQERHATDNQNIFVIGGGYGCDRETIPLKSVELYNIAERSSKIVKEFEQPLVSSALCVHDSRILVSGGVGDEDNSDEIKVLNTNQHLQFAMLGKLPFKLFGHDVVVHEGNLYVIGGCIWHERKTSNEIYQISLTPPYAAELLTKMPEPRRHHRAAIVNGKLFILGGAPTGKSEDAISSVFQYDLIKKEFKQRPSLPRPVSRMSIVTWGDKIVAFGGMDKGGRAINDVIMYDTETGRNERLPGMIHKRFGSSAVITNDVIVVFGGWNDEQGYLNSVESFTIGGDRWEELPGMIKGRCWATAAVKPHISF